AGDAETPGAADRGRGAQEGAPLVQPDRAAVFCGPAEHQAGVLRDVVAVRDAAVAAAVQVRGRDARQGQVDGPAVADRIADVAGPVHGADREGVIALAQAAEVGTAAGRVAAAVQAVLQVIDSGEGVVAGEGEARALAGGQARRVAVDARRRFRLVDVDAADG